MPEVHSSEKRTKLIITVLAVAVIILSAALAALWLSGWMAGQQQDAFTTGYQQGVAAAVVEIMQRSQSCQQVPLIAGNTTITLIDTACLKTA